MARLYLCNHCGADVPEEDLNSGEDSDGPLLFCVASKDCNERRARLAQDEIDRIEADRAGAVEALEQQGRPS